MYFFVKSVFALYAVSTYHDPFSKGSNKHVSRTHDKFAIKRFVVKTKKSGYATFLRQV